MVVVRFMREYTLKEVVFYNYLFVVFFVFTLVFDIKVSRKDYTGGFFFSLELEVIGISLVVRVVFILVFSF